MNLAILASGNGTNAEAIIERVQAGKLVANIPLIISNRPEAAVLQKAAKANIPCECINNKKFSNRLAYEQEVLKALKAVNADCIALAGYMLLLSPSFLAKFRDPILNIHPALLPAFPGLKGIADAMEYGVKIIGVSVHFVTEDMDSGPLIIQGAIPLVQKADKGELTQKIHEVEHRIYPQALQWLSQGRLTLVGRHTILEHADYNQAPVPADWLVYPPLEEGF